MWSIFFGILCNLGNIRKFFWISKEKLKKKKKKFKLNKLNNIIKDVLYDRNIFD